MAILCTRRDTRKQISLHTSSYLYVQGFCAEKKSFDFGFLEIFTLNRQLLFALRFGKLLRRQQRTCLGRNCQHTLVQQH